MCYFQISQYDDLHLQAETGNAELSILEIIVGNTKLHASDLYRKLTQTANNCESLNFTQYEFNKMSSK